MSTVAASHEPASERRENTLLLSSSSVVTEVGFCPVCFFMLPFDDEEEAHAFRW